jgi:hypothetical protein
MGTFIAGEALGQWFFLVAFAAILYFCFRIVQPFLLPIFPLLILSTLLWPAYTAVATP